MPPAPTPRPASLKNTLARVLVIGGSLSLFVILNVLFHSGPDTSSSKTQAAPAPEVVTVPVEPAPPRIETPFDLLGVDAVEIDYFSGAGSERFVGGEDAWALYPKKATDCDGELLSNPPGNNDFERRDNEGLRQELQDKYVGKMAIIRESFTRFAGSGADDLDGGERLGLAIGEYDFAKHTFKFVISGWMGGLGDEVGASWSLGGPDPKWVWQSGGQVYLDPGTRSFVWKIEEADARTWLESAQTVDLEVLTTFQGLGFHKQCKNVCATLLGYTSCAPWGKGVGRYVRNTIDGIRVSTDDQIIYEWVRGKVTTPAATVKD